MVAPEETLHAFGDTSQFLLSVHRRPTGPHEDVSLWQAAFNFSPAECKVAAHLFAGKPPKEIAKALHVSPSTIKTHLDSLFAKTRTGRQAELVRVLGMVVE
jgi:DNA-binding CsgD family transcriptional regulator